MSTTDTFIKCQQLTRLLCATKILAVDSRKDRGALWHFSLGDQSRGQTL